MPKLNDAMSTYAKTRWPKWLKRSMDGANWSNSKLANVLSEGERNAPRAAIADFLRAKRAPTPTMAWRIGQKLALAGLGPEEPYFPRPGGHADLPSFVTRPPAVGGLMALFGCGHFRESMAVMLALLSGDNPDGRAYAIRFAPVCWAANADLDRLDGAFPSVVQATWRRYIGDAPLEALETAWQRRGRFMTQSDALLDLGLLRLDQEIVPRNEAIYFSGVIAWRAFIDVVSCRRALQSASAEDAGNVQIEWELVAKVSDTYWREVVLKKHASS